MSLLSQYAKHEFVQESANNSWSNMYSTIREGARVLDVGCSTGNFGEALKDLKNCEVVGVDISESDVAIAKTKLSAAHLLDITDTAAAATLGKFDVVIFADVIEHLPDPRAALRAVLGMLNDGGIVVYSIPHMGHHSVRFDLLEGKFPYTELGLLDRTHLHYYDRFEVHDVFAAAGYRIVEENPTFSGHSVPWTSERLALLGLTANPRFFDMLKSTDADIYQFVGVAVPAGEAPQVPAEQREEITPPDQLLQHANNVAAENERLSAELDSARRQIAELHHNPVGAFAKAAARRLRRR